MGLMKICEFCGKPILSNYLRARFCSVQCRERHRQEKLSRNWKSHVCPECGHVFRKGHPQKFCSDLCRKRFYKNRKTRVARNMSLKFQDYVLSCAKREEEKSPEAHENAVWIRTGGIYPGFLLSPEEVERFEEVWLARTGGKPPAPVTRW